MVTGKEIEAMFNRSCQFAFSKKKLLFLFPVLVVCGIMIVFCRALSVGSNDWIVLSLTFLPVFLCSGVLLAAGVILTRMYHYEVKSLKLGFRALLKQSWELLIGISYLSLPPLLVYLLLWMLMGLFYLLKEIPAVGEFACVVLSFGPFLLVLGSIVLSLLNLLLLFFVTPHVASSENVRLKLAEEVIARVGRNPCKSAMLFLLGLVPLLFILGMLCAAAFMTGSSFSIDTSVLSIALQWFFIMVPFCALLAPGVIFFFNFAYESYVLVLRAKA